MKLTILTDNNLERQEVPAENLVQLEVTIGNTKYMLSERDGGLRVSTDGQLVAKLGGANILTLSAE